MEGISFIVRVRNEEETLEQSLQSLQGLTIPHEIIVILHRCTDRSKEIASQFQVRIIEYEIPLSRAGLETMATDEDSVHSIVHYNRWCFSHAQYVWIFRWDADFIATPELRSYLNERSWTKPLENTKIYLNAKSDDIDNLEGYLTSGNFKHTKYVFWEFFDTSECWFRIDSDATIQHISSLSTLKPYWTEPPWYEAETPEAEIVRTRMESIRKLVGDEPVGQARASDPRNWDTYSKCLSLTTAFEALGIRLRSSS